MCFPASEVREFYSCQKCLQQFYSITDFICHLEDEIASWIGLQPIDHRMCVDETDFKAHTYKYENLFGCFLCNVTFCSGRDLSKHLLRCHCPWMCDVCKEQTACLVRSSCDHPSVQIAVCDSFECNQECFEQLRLYYSNKYFAMTVRCEPVLGNCRSCRKMKLLEFCAVTCDEKHLIRTCEDEKCILSAFELLLTWNKKRKFIKQQQRSSLYKHVLLKALKRNSTIENM